MFRVLVLGLSFLAAIVSTANAQWLYNADKSAFGDGGKFIALTANQFGYGFALRCVGNGPEVILMTPDTSLTDSAAMAANAVNPPTLLVRVDNTEVQKIIGEFVVNDGKVGVLAKAPQPLFKQIQDARKRVAVAIDFSEIMHETKFGVRGSTRSIKKLIRDCKLDEPVSG